MSRSAGQSGQDVGGHRLCRAPLWGEIRVSNSANSQRCRRVCEAFDEEHQRCGLGDGVHNDGRLSRFPDERPRQGKLSNCEFHLVLCAGTSAGLAAEPCGQRILKLGVCGRARNRASARLCPAAAVGSAKGARESGRTTLDSGDCLICHGPAITCVEPAQNCHILRRDTMSAWRILKPSTIVCVVSGVLLFIYVRPLTLLSMARCETRSKSEYWMVPKLLADVSIEQ